MEFYHELSDLHPVHTGWHIRVKVMRAFLVPLAHPYNMLGLIFADENGVQIEAVVNRDLSLHYWQFMDEGKWFSIMNFAVAYNSAVTKPTHHQYKIIFLPATVVKKSMQPHETPHRSLASFSDIVDDSIDDSVLVDVVGAVIKVGPLKNTAYNPTDVNGFRIRFEIKDKDERVLECVALKQEALEFDRNYRLYGGDDLVVVLKWWKIYRYWDGPNNVRLCTNGPISKICPNPNTPEVAEIREMLARIAQGNVEHNGPGVINLD